MFRILGALRIYHLNHFQQPNELELHYGSLLCQELHRILEAVVLPKMICYVILRNYVLITWNFEWAVEICRAVWRCSFIAFRFALYRASSFIISRFPLFAARWIGRFTKSDKSSDTDSAVDFEDNVSASLSSWNGVPSRNHLKSDMRTSNLEDQKFTWQCIEL